MNCLIFISATNGQHSFNILNGTDGGTVDHNVHIDKPRIRIEPKDYLLDDLTGDLYRYFDKKWNPFTNCGLHSR